MVRRSSTLMTPGADQAAARAASYSEHERTLPVSVTVPWELSTAMSSASSLASRSRAFLMEWRTSPELGVGLMRSFGCSLGFALLPKTADGASQRHGAIIRGHRDPLAVDFGIPEQLVGDVELQCLVSWAPSSRGTARCGGR